MAFFDKWVAVATAQNRERLSGLFSRTAATETCCWEWQGAIKSGRSGGYGLVQAERGKTRMVRVHRLVAELLGWEIAGLGVLHHCDNPRCCNPTHLFVGTQIDNMRDCQKKGRLPPRPSPNWPERMKTTRHHWQKLSPDDVRQIRSRVATGETQRSIAADFGVRQDAVSRIVTGRNWSHLTEGI